MFVADTRGFDPAEGPVPDFCWPRSLAERPSSPQLVYLDLNHWIGLAKARAGHPDGDRLQPVLEACRQARQRGDVVFPLSDSLYVEMSKIRDPRQRQDVAAIMEELSGFATMLALPTVMRLELDAVLTSIVGPPGGVLPQLPLLGFGIFWAFGRVGLRIDDGHGGDVTEVFAKAQPDAFREMNLLAERRLLAGPLDSEVDDLREDGWRPETAFETCEQRAQQEREQAVRFAEDERWRRGRTRDILLARHVIIELLESILPDALDPRGISLADVAGDPDRARYLVRAMPSAEVSTELKRAAHRNPQTRWTANDIIDIDAMSLALPYCDVVVTEKHRAQQLRAAHLDDRLGTTLLSRLTDLPSHLGPANEEAG